MGEAMSGVVHRTGFPDGPPVHTGFAHADSVDSVDGGLLRLARADQATRPRLRRRMDRPCPLRVALSPYRMASHRLRPARRPRRTRRGNQLPVAPNGSVINTLPTADDTYVSVTAAPPAPRRNIVRLLELSAKTSKNRRRTGLPRQPASRVDRQPFRRRRPTQDACPEVVAARVYSPPTSSKIPSTPNATTSSPSKTPTSDPSACKLSSPNSSTTPDTSGERALRSERTTTWYIGPTSDSRPNAMHNSAPTGPFDPQAMLISRD